MSAPGWPSALCGVLPLLALLFGLGAFGVYGFAHRWTEDSGPTNVTATLDGVARMNIAGEIEDGVLTLAGELPSQEARRSLLDFVGGLNARNPIVDLVDRLTIVDRLAPGGFDSVARGVAHVASLCVTGRAALHEGTISVLCTVARADVAGVQSVVERLSSERPLGTVEVLVSEEVGLCDGQLADLLGESSIEFAPGSDRFEASAQLLLDRLAEIAGQCPGKLRIEGHTDSAGHHPDISRSLSQARAEAVLDALASRGIERARLLAVGYGQDDPVDDNTTAEGRQRNRRIEVHAAPFGY